MKKTAIMTLLSTVLAFGGMSVYANHHEGGHAGKHEMNADANKDGKVSFDEFKAVRDSHMKAQFERKDSNKDGFIDETEKQAAKAKWKEHRANMKEKCAMHK